jgi:hypothetical protein
MGALRHLTSPLPSPVTTPLCLPDGGVTETRKATSNEVASFIFDAGQKSALRDFSENAPLSQHAGSCFAKVLLLGLDNIRFCLVIRLPATLTTAIFLSGVVFGLH